MIAALLLLAAAEPKLDCSDPQNQSYMNFCALQDYQRADTEMNAQYRLAVARLRSADKDVDRAIDRQPLYYNTLVAAQRAWLTFRDQHCLLASFEARGGSMQPMLESLCKAELTKQRTQQLKSMVETEN